MFTQISILKFGLSISIIRLTKPFIAGEKFLESIFPPKNFIGIKFHWMIAWKPINHIVLNNSKTGNCQTKNYNDSLDVYLFLHFIEYPLKNHSVRSMYFCLHFTIQSRLRCFSLYSTFFFFFHYIFFNYIHIYFLVFFLLCIYVFVYLIRVCLYFFFFRI